MSSVVKTETAEDIVRRLEWQRARLHQQFAPKPEPAAETAMATLPASTMEPHEYKSLLMRVLVANPQLIKRALILVATTALGARYSSWTMKLVGFFLASRPGVRR